MRTRVIPALAAALALAAAGAARADDGRAMVISTGQRVELAEHLRPEGTTCFLFLNAGSAMEQKFLEDLEKRLPRREALALRVIRLRSLEDAAAKQHEVAATPTVLVLDRFGRSLARTSDPEQVTAAVEKGLRVPRIHWIDELDPKAPDVYRRPAEALRRGIPGIVKTMSLRADVMDMFMQMSRIHFSDGFLKRREHELIAAYVSGLNKCRF